MQLDKIPDIESNKAPFLRNSKFQLVFIRITGPTLFDNVNGIVAAFTKGICKHQMDIFVKQQEQQGLNVHAGTDARDRTCRRQ